MRTGMDKGGAKAERGYSGSTRGIQISSVDNVQLLQILE